MTSTFLLTSAYWYDPRILADRVPPVGQIEVIAPPYTDAYVGALAEAAAHGRFEGIPLLEQRWPELRTAGKDDLLVPLVSSDIWSPSSVGAWMTQREYETVVSGTRMIFDGLALFAQRRGCKIFIPVDEAIEAVIPPGATPSSRLVLLPYSGLPQEDHAQMLGMSSFAISRTGGQSNAFAVLAVAETPTIIVDMPDEGYMQAELTSIAATHDSTVSDTGRVSARPRAEPLAYLARWDWTAEGFAALLEDLTSNPSAAASRAASAHRSFDALRGSSRNSLLALLGQRLGHGQAAKD